MMMEDNRDKMNRISQTEYWVKEVREYTMTMYCVFPFYKGQKQAKQIYGVSVRTVVALVTEGLQGTWRGMQDAGYSGVLIMG